MKELISQTKWQFVLLYRNNLILISIALTSIYALIFYVVKDLGNMDKLLTLLIYNDPAIIGLFLIGLSIIVEKNQEVLSAIFTTPINHHYYLVSKILSLSIIGWACGLGMAISILGFSFNIIHFSAGVFGTCLLFSMAGIILVSYTTDFLLLILRSIPILLFLSLPLLNYFNITHIQIFYLIPIQGCLNLIIHSYMQSLSLLEVLYGYASLIFWIPIFYYLAYRIFSSKIINI